MQNVEIEISEEEFERWNELSEEQKAAVPKLAFIRAINDRWHILKAERDGVITRDEARCRVDLLLD